MKACSYLVILVVAASCAACSSSPEKDAVVESFERFQKGLKDADGEALWGVIDDATRTYFDEFASSIRKTCALIREYYPADDKVQTLRSVGGDLEASARDGRSLFVYMLDARKLEPPENRDSTVVREILLQDSTATIVTRSGETIIFTRNGDGSWGTRMFLAAFRELPAIVTLTDNIKVAQENCRLLGIDVDRIMSAK